MPSLRSGIGAYRDLLALKRRQAQQQRQGGVTESGGLAFPPCMTTAMPSKPRRTMLPPNLTRNYYEVKRLIAEGEGRTLPHWYQLTAEQQAAEDLDVELFRRAILRSEEEQDLVAKFNAPAAQEPPAAEAAAFPGFSGQSDSVKGLCFSEKSGLLSEVLQ